MLDSISSIRRCSLAIVDRLEFGSINGDERFREQVELPAQQDELATDFADRFAIVLAKAGNGIEVGHQVTGQPHQFDVALCFPLEAPARLNPVEIKNHAERGPDERAQSRIRMTTPHLG